MQEGLPFAFVVNPCPPAVLLSLPPALSAGSACGSALNAPAPGSVSGSPSLAVLLSMYRTQQVAHMHQAAAAAATAAAQQQELAQDAGSVTPGPTVVREI